MFEMTEVGAILPIKRSRSNCSSNGTTLLSFLELIPGVHNELVALLVERALVMDLLPGQLLQDGAPVVDSDVWEAVQVLDPLLPHFGVNFALLYSEPDDINSLRNSLFDRLFVFLSHIALVKFKFNNDNETQLLDHLHAVFNHVKLLNEV